MILILDNFDSFTFNLEDYFNQLNVETIVIRNDQPLNEIIRYNYQGIVISPGPGVPSDSGGISDVIAYYVNQLPILGVCLGHQALGDYFGARIIKAEKPMHGKVSEIILDNDYLFHNLPDRIDVVRYHSLVLSDLPRDMESIAISENGEIMAIRHKAMNIRGLQFHPEAILTRFGINILKNWVTYNKIIQT